MSRFGGKSSVRSQIVLMDLSRHCFEETKGFELEVSFRAKFNWAKELSQLIVPPRDIEL